jgi:hypothetical protein
MKSNLGCNRYSRKRPRSQDCNSRCNRLRRRSCHAPAREMRQCADQPFAGRTPSSSIRREVGSSSRDGQLRHVKIVRAGGVAAGDPGLFIVRHALQDPRQDLAPIGLKSWQKAVASGYVTGFTSKPNNALKACFDATPTPRRVAVKDRSPPNSANLSGLSVGAARFSRCRVGRCNGQTPAGWTIGSQSPHR